MGLGGGGGGLIYGDLIHGRSIELVINKSVKNSKLYKLKTMTVF